jgi:hypothetical protein
VDEETLVALPGDLTHPHLERRAFAYLFRGSIGSRHSG